MAAPPANAGARTRTKIRDPRTRHAPTRPQTTETPPAAPTTPRHHLHALYGDRLRPIGGLGLTNYRRTTAVLLGHEHHGVPEEAWPLIDDIVEIPMVGQGASLNVAVAGSLVLYRRAGLA